MEIPCGVFELWQCHGGGFYKDVIAVCQSAHREGFATLQLC